MDVDKQKAKTLHIGNTKTTNAKNRSEFIKRKLSIIRIPQTNEYTCANKRTMQSHF